MITEIRMSTISACQTNQNETHLYLFGTITTKINIKIRKIKNNKKPNTKPEFRKFLWPITGNLVFFSTSYECIFLCGPASKTRYFFPLCTCLPEMVRSRMIVRPNNSAKNKKLTKSPKTPGHKLFQIVILALAEMQGKGTASPGAVISSVGTVSFVFNFITKRVWTYHSILTVYCLRYFVFVLKCINNNNNNRNIITVSRRE